MGCGGGGGIFLRNLAGTVTGCVAFGLIVAVHGVPSAGNSVFEISPRSVEFGPQTFTNAFSTKNCTNLVPYKI